MSVHYIEFQKIIENVYGETISEDIRAQISKVFTPVGNCPVARSKNFVFVVMQCLRGLYPQQVSDILNKEKKEYLAPYVIRDYLIKNIPPHLIRSNVIAKWLENSAPIDEISLLENIIRIQYSRVLERIDQPILDQDDSESRRRDIQLLGRITEVSLKAKVATGRVQSAPQEVKVIHSGETKQEISITESRLDPRSAARVLKVLEKVGSLGSLLADGSDEDTN